MKNDPSSIFNRTIDLFIQEHPISSFSRTVALCKDYFPRYHNDYYQMFDSINFRLGITWVTNDIGNNQYAPKLIIEDSNILNLKPGVLKEVDEDTPISLEECYVFIAKELIYSLQALSNLEQVLKKISAA